MILDDKIKITTDHGEIVEAQAPLIISASRSTDIPAFYAKWFINRLKAGYVIWYNPFNQKPTYVSFKRTKVIVFWTKNPKPLMPYLKELDELGIHYYFQYTLNDYEKEGFEPNVPKLEQRIETFKKLSSMIGKEKVIWRFDPLIVTDQLSPRDLLIRIWNLGQQLKEYTNKLVFSFIDIKAYKKVQNNLVRTIDSFSKENIDQAEMTQAQIEEIAQGLSKIQAKWKEEGHDIALGTCAEGANLESYNIEHNRCIDGELMKQIFSEDKDLLFYLNYGKLPEHNTLFGNEELEPILVPIEKFKDKGQRKQCGCMKSKDIGMYNTCSHFCVYCYANTSKKAVQNNLSKHNDQSESLI